MVCKAMDYKAAISDWSGSLFKHPTDEVLNKTIGHAVKKRLISDLAKFKLWKAPKVYKLLETKKELEKRLKEYEADERPLHEVYDTFNKEVLRGLDPDFLYGVIDQYIEDNANKVDKRILRQIGAVHDRGIKTGIISVSLDYVIQRILRRSEADGFFEKIIANKIASGDDNKIKGFTLDIYGKKTEVLESEFLDPWGLTKENVVYIGDSKDDEPIADILPEGRFIVPFFAKDDFKQDMYSKYGAFIPDNEQHLKSYLGLE